MDKLKSKSKAIPRIKQEEKWTMNNVQPKISAPRTDITVERRKELRKKKERKVKNSDFFETKKKGDKKD